MAHPAALPAARKSPRGGSARSRLAGWFRAARARLRTSATTPSRPRVW